MSKSIRKMRGIQIWHPYYILHQVYDFAQHIFGTFLIKKSFWHLKIENDIYNNILKIVFGNNVFYTKTHICEKYRHIITKYGTGITIT